MTHNAPQMTLLWIGRRLALWPLAIGKFWLRELGSFILTDDCADLTETYGETVAITPAG